MYLTKSGNFIYACATFFVLLFSSSVARAALVKGKIKDNKGAAVPFASVFIPATTIGTAANANGEYQLNLDPGSYTISCQSIGYKQISFKITVAGDAVLEQNFTLADEGLAMKEVVVRSGKDEDPAYRIMRKVIKQRLYHLKQVRAFQSAIYLKGVIRTTEVPDKIIGVKVDKQDVGVDSTGKGVIYLLEEKAQYYAQEPDKERTVVHSVRQSGNAQGLGFAQMPSVITFYENNVRIMDQLAPRGLVSPFAENAISFYKYKLEGELVENNQIIYKISVKPRRQFEPVFEGTVYIAADDWAIHSLSLTASDKAGLEFVESIKIEQQFVSLRSDTWVIQRQVFYPAFNLLGFKLTGNFVTVYNNQKVNEPLPDSIFNKKIISTYDATANKKDSAYWTAERPIPLEEDEVKDYRVKDSIAALPKDLHREDSLRKRRNRIGIADIISVGKTIVGKGGKQRFSFDGLIYATNYNSVEGLNAAPVLRYERALDTGNTLNAKMALRYGFENRHFNAMAGLSYTHNDRKWPGRNWTLGAAGGKYVFQYNSANPVDPFYNTVSTLFQNQNYLKIYERYDAAVYFRRNMGNGFAWNAKLNYQYRLPLENVSDYSWAKGDRAPMTDNVPDELKGYYWGKHNAMLIKLGISYKPGTTYIQYPDFKSPVSGKWPVFSLNYEKGISGLFDSKVNFDKWKFGIEGAQRLKLLGVLSYNLSAGGFLNDNTVSLPDLMHLTGNQYFLASSYLNSFQIAPFYKFSNTEKIYGEAHVEYNLYGLFTNKIPLFRRLNWYFILGNNTFYAGDNKYYTEGFLSIDNIGYKIYRFLRVDLVHSWESNGINRTGIRLGLRTAGVIGRRDKNEEW